MNPSQPEQDETAIIQTADVLDHEKRRQYDEACAVYDQEIQSLVDEITQSERLTKDDFAIRINAH